MDTDSVKYMLSTDRRHTESALYQDRPGLSVDDGGLDLLPPEDERDDVRGFLGQRRYERAGVSYLKQLLVIFWFSTFTPKHLEGGGEGEGEGGGGHLVLLGQEAAELQQHRIIQPGVLRRRRSMFQISYVLFADLLRQGGQLSVGDGRQGSGEQLGVDPGLGAVLRGRDLLHLRVQDRRHDRLPAEGDRQLRGLGLSHLILSIMSIIMSLTVSEIAIRSILNVLPDLCDVGAAVGDGLGDLGAGDLVLLAAGLRQPGGGAGQRQEAGQEILQLRALLDSGGEALRHRLHAVQGLGGLLREHLAAHTTQLLQIKQINILSAVTFITTTLGYCFRCN